MIALALAWPGAARAQRERVDLALVLAVDVSDSVDEKRYALQMDGIARAFEDPQVLRDCRHAHVERLGELGDRAFARGKTGKNGPPRRIGEGGEGGAEMVGTHGVKNQMVN